MTFIAALTAPAFIMIAQVGPNPGGGGLLGVPDELLNRPPREEEQAGAALDPSAQWLSDCLDLLEQDASRAHTMAQLQRNSSFGPDRVLANHCLGLAASELQLWHDALTAFGAARDETPAEEPQVRARFGTMAGLAAMASGDIKGALPILQQGKLDAATGASAPLQAIAATQLARALVADGQTAEALNELEIATSLQPDNAESWLLKATLLRRLERLPEAQSAIERAGDLAPQDPQIGLEAGVIAVLSGRDEVARASWQSVVALAPDTPEAETATDYLAQLGPPVDDGSAPIVPQQEPS